jgi:hypothetical protein
MILQVDEKKNWKTIVFYIIKKTDLLATTQEASSLIGPHTHSLHSIISKYSSFPKFFQNQPRDNEPAKKLSHHLWVSLFSSRFSHHIFSNSVYQLIFYNLKIYLKLVRVFSIDSPSRKITKNYLKIVEVILKHSYLIYWIITIFFSNPNLKFDYSILEIIQRW